MGQSYGKREKYILTGLKENQILSNSLKQLFTVYN